MFSVDQILAPGTTSDIVVPEGVELAVTHSQGVEIFEKSGMEWLPIYGNTQASQSVVASTSTDWKIKNNSNLSLTVSISEVSAGGGSGSLAAGAATEAAQDTGNASLASLDAKADNFATEATLQAQVSEAQASNTLLGLIKTLLDAIKTLTQALLVKATPEIVTPIISQSDGTFPLNNAAQFGAFYDDLEGGTGTCNGVNVTHGYEISSPDNRHIAAGSFTLLSSNTGRWVTQETP